MNDVNESGWQQRTLERALLASIKEQAARRRWGIFFKILLFIFLFLLLWLFWPTENMSAPVTTKSHIAVVDVRGEISDDTPASAENIMSGLDDAFKDKNTKAVILNINSPGGSPVQAADVYNEINYLRGKHKDIKVFAVCSDICTSAAYYIASSADYIYADKTSLVGSIGVLMDGFGFVDTLQKVGMQRRLITSGSHKGFLDPFSPMKPEELQYAQNMLNDVHQQFILDVQKGRGARLKGNPDIFSGLVWTGNQAIPLGLIDGFGDINYVARTVIRNDNILDYTVKPNFFEQVAKRFGSSFAHQIAGELGLEFKGLS